MNITRLQDHKITINFKWTTPAVFETVSSHGREEEGGRSQKTPPTRLAPTQKVKSFILKLCTYVILFLDYILTVSVTQ